jgi:hypothetical protein
MAGVFGSWLLTHYRRKRINHRFRRSSLTKPHQKFTCVHPSDLPFARSTWMVQAPLGLHPSAFARFVTWRLQGSGTWLDTSQEHDNESCSLKLERLRVASPSPNRACGRVGRRRVALLGTFPSAPPRTARESFDLKQLSSDLCLKLVSLRSSLMDDFVTRSFMDNSQNRFGVSHLAYLDVLAIRSPVPLGLVVGFPHLRLLRGLRRLGARAL